MAYFLGLEFNIPITMHVQVKQISDGTIKYKLNIFILLKVARKMDTYFSCGSPTTTIYSMLK